MSVTLLLHLYYIKPMKVIFLKALTKNIFQNINKHKLSRFNYKQIQLENYTIFMSSTLAAGINLRISRKICD